MRLMASKTFSSSPRALAPTAKARRGLGELDRLEGHRFFGLAEGVEGRRVAQFGDGYDVAGYGFGDGVALLAHEVRDAPQPLLGAGARVGQGLVRAAAAAHDPEHAQAAGVGVNVGLERVGGEGAVRVAGDFVAFLRDPTRQVRGARGAAGDHVQQAVYPDHALRARRQDGDDEAVGDALADAVEGLLGRDLLPFQILLQERVVALGDGLEELRRRRVHLVFHAGGDLYFLFSVHEGGSCEETVDPPQVVLLSDGQIERDDGLAEAVPELLDHGPEVGALPVQVVHDDDVGDAFLLAAAPHALGDDLYRVLGVDHQDRAVGDPLGDKGVPDEAPVPGGVEDIDLAPLPFEAGDAHAQRHAPFGLFFGVVERAARRGVSSRREPDHTFCYRGLTASAVPDQAHVPDGLRLHSHGFLLSSVPPLRPSPRAGHLAYRRETLRAGSPVAPKGARLRARLASLESSREIGSEP